MSETVNNEPTGDCAASRPIATPVAHAVSRAALIRIRAQCENLAQKYHDVSHVYAEEPVEWTVLETDVPYYLDMGRDLYPPRGPGPVAVPAGQKVLRWFSAASNGIVQSLELLYGETETLRRVVEPLWSVLNPLHNVTTGLDRRVYADLLQVDSASVPIVGNWLALVHRLAWQKRPGSPLQATRTTWTVWTPLHVSNAGVLAAGEGFDFPYDQDVAARVLSVWQRTGEQEKIEAVKNRIGFPPRHFISPLPLDVFTALATSIDLLLEAWDRHGSMPVVSASAPNQTDNAPNRFVLRGKIWELSYTGKNALFSDRDGFGYLYTLLKRAGTPVPAVELYTGGTLLQYASTLGYLRIDEKTRREVAAAIDSGGMSEADKKKAEKYLQESLRGVGKYRQFSDEVESMRSTVRQRIKAAIGSIRKDLPELANHLESKIKTGSECIYLPGMPPPVWDL